MFYLRCSYPCEIPTLRVEYIVHSVSVHHLGHILNDVSKKSAESSDLENFKDSYISRFNTYVFTSKNILNITEQM